MGRPTPGPKDRNTVSSEHRTTALAGLQRDLQHWPLAVTPQ